MKNLYDSITYRIIERIFEIDSSNYYDSIVYSSDDYDNCENMLKVLLESRRVDNTFIMVEI